MITQNTTILTDLIEMKQRDLRREADAARLARAARPERRLMIRIAGRRGWWRRLISGWVRAPHQR